MKHGATNSAFISPFLLFSTLAIGLVAPAFAFGAVPLTRAEAYQLIEEMMVEGTFGSYLDVPVEHQETRELRFFPSFLNDAPFDSSKINPNPLRTGYGISLGDGRGRALWGLKGGGGWTIRGGLTDRTHRGGMTLDLFGFQVLRWYNGFVDGYYKYKEMVYEFYLVVRADESAKGSIVRSWTIGYNEIVFQPYQQDVQRLRRDVDQGVISKRQMEKILNDPGNRAEHIEAVLGDAANSDEVQVRIRGLSEQFVQTVRIE